MSHLATVDDVARPLSAGYEAALGDLLLRLAVTPQSQLELQTADPTAQRIDTGDTPEELSETFPAHALEDLTGGEGLFFAHRRSTTERDPTRFWRSSGIDNAPTLPGETAGIRLLHDTEVAESDTSTNPYMAVLGTVAYFADGPDVKRVANPLAGAPSVTTEDPDVANADALTGLVRLGDELFASSPNGIHIRSSGGTWSDLASSVATTRLWSAKARLLSVTGSGNVLSEVDASTGSPTTLLTLPSGETFTDVKDGGAAILAAATTGHVYALVPDNTGALKLQGQTEFADYEYPRVIHEAFGIVLVGTVEDTNAGGAIGRLYTAKLGVDPDGSYVLTSIQLIRVFDNASLSVDRAPRWMGQRRDSIYVGVRGSSETKLWRYHVATGSLTEDLVFGVENDMYGIGVVDNTLLVTIAGNGLYREMTDYVASGYLIGPAADFYSARDKAYLYGKLEGELAANPGSEISMALSTDLDAMNDPTHSSWITVVTAYDASQLGVMATIVGQLGRFAILKITLMASDDAATTPIMQSATVFMYPQTEELLVLLPVNVSDRVEMPHRSPFTVRGLGNRLYQELLSRQGAPAVLQLYRPGITLRGTVEAVSQRVPGEGRQSSNTFIAFVRFRGRIAQTGSQPTGSSTLGLSALGIDVMGV